MTDSVTPTLTQALTQALTHGRAAEARGDMESAWRAYDEGGHLDEAVRVLLGLHHLLVAGELIVTRLLQRPQPLLDNEHAWGIRAAQLLEQGRAFARAAELLVWLGASAQARSLVEQLLQAGLLIEAAACLVHLGEPGRALELLGHTPRGHVDYSRACQETARALARGALITMELDRFLADFIRKGPDDDEQAEALYAIAAAFSREDMAENALECRMRIEARRPGFRDVAARACALEAGERTEVAAFARVLEEDARFAGLGPPGARRPMKPGPTTMLQHPADNVAAAAASTVDPFAPGVVVLERYRLEEIIGHGGMSVVYRATDLELNDLVALKLFTQATNEDALARFKQEVLVARQLHHRNIVRVHDIGTAFGARFLTMELLRGEDLHTKMTRGVSLRDGIDLLIQACAGLEAAHHSGVIHRDIKPENLFVTDENVVKVTDFGIAKQVRQRGLTLAGMIIGTPEYLAPEQANGHMEVTPRADLYSMGIILYCLATLSLPFRHAELVPLLMMHVNDKPEPPHMRNPLVPPQVDALIMQLLEKDPALRPPSARALGERLLDLRLKGAV